MRTAQRVLFVALVFILASCNGDGDNGMAAATVTIDVAPTEITLGQSATLTWSTNGATCTASGDWSGAQDASGTLTVTPTTTGEHTYSLMCTGGSYGQSNSVSATLTVDEATAFSMSSLISDGSVTAAATDANLVNPWGIVFAPGAPAWVANNATQTATVYNGTGTVLPHHRESARGPQWRRGRHGHREQHEHDRLRGHERNRYRRSPLPVRR